MSRYPHTDYAMGRRWARPDASRANWSLPPFEECATYDALAEDDDWLDANRAAIAMETRRAETTGSVAKP